MADQAKRRRSARAVGQPMGVVLYRTAECWRFSLILAAPNGIACGALDHLDPTSDETVAQEAMGRRLHEIVGQSVDIDWQTADQPDWWNGAVRRRAAAASD